MNAQRIKQVQEALQKRGATNPCARCDGREMSVLGQTVQVFNENPDVFALGGPSLPLIMVGCNTCGHVVFHAPSALGL